MDIVRLVEVPGSPPGSLGLVLPENVLARLQLSAGDTVQLTETPLGLRLRSVRGAGETPLGADHDAGP